MDPFLGRQKEGEKNKTKVNNKVKRLTLVRGRECIDFTLRAPGWARHYQSNSLIWTSKTSSAIGFLPFSILLTVHAGLNGLIDPKWFLRVNLLQLISRDKKWDLLRVEVGGVRGQLEGNNSGANRETPMEPCGSDLIPWHLYRPAVIPATTCALSLTTVNDTYGRISITRLRTINTWFN